MNYLEITLSFVFDGIDDSDSAQAKEIVKKFGALMSQFKKESQADSVWCDEVKIANKHEVVFGDISFYENRAVIRTINEISYLSYEHIDNYAKGREWIVPNDYDGEIVWPEEEKA